MLVKIDIQEENGGEGAPEEQYGIYQAFGIQVFKEELLEFQCLKRYKSCVEATGGVEKRKQ